MFHCENNKKLSIASGILLDGDMWHKKKRQIYGKREFSLNGKKV